jgi:hypothetical protein
VDPGVFWNTYYLIIFLLMMSFVVKARMRVGDWSDPELEVIRETCLRIYLPF